MIPAMRLFTLALRFEVDGRNGRYRPRKNAGGKWRTWNLCQPAIGIDSKSEMLLLAPFTLHSTFIALPSIRPVKSDKHQLFRRMLFERLAIRPFYGASLVPSL
jgi:hypothetical protein